MLKSHIPSSRYITIVLISSVTLFNTISSIYFFNILIIYIPTQLFILTYNNYSNNKIII